MGKLIALVVLVVAVVWLLKRAISGPGPRRRADDEAPHAAAPRELVSCAHCGVNLPRGEARMAGGTLYCGEEHARLGPRRP
jgi:uncharacterized protein